MIPSFYPNDISPKYRVVGHIYCNPIIYHFIAILSFYHGMYIHTIPYHTIRYDTIRYHTIRYHTIPYHTIRYHTIPYHTIPYDTIPYYTYPLSIRPTLYTLYAYIHHSYDINHHLPHPIHAIHHWLIVANMQTSQI